MNVDWVQPHMQKESKFPNLETQTVMINPYERFVYLFLTEQQTEFLLQENPLPVSKVKKHVYGYSLEWPKAVPLS